MVVEAWLDRLDEESRVEEAGPLDPVDVAEKMPLLPLLADEMVLALV